MGQQAEVSGNKYHQSPRGTLFAIISPGIIDIEDTRFKGKGVRSDEKRPPNA
jgi:hypothetical protein